MKTDKQHTPPRWAKKLLSIYCRTELLEDLEGDLNEYFERNVKSKGIFRAKLIYILDVFKFFKPYMIRRPAPFNGVNVLVIYQNYYKTSFRTIRRNKLFSFINVFVESFV